MRFTKMHGLGNDFVVLDPDAVPAGATLDALAARLCARRTGIGADGLLIVGSRDADGAWRLAIVNADGSVATACGNGARCVARYLGRGEHVLRTPAEDVRVAWDGAVATVRLRAPRLGGRRLVALPEGETPVRLVDVGNRHAVVLGLPPDDVDLALVAARVREAVGDANVGVVALDAKDRLWLRVDERGVGETLACGTGACAAVAAVRVEGWVGDRLIVRLPGGDLDVALDGDAMVLRGDARESFRGEWTG